MLGNERFLLPRASKAHAFVNVSWFYPNTYAVGQFGLGYQLVWRLFEEDPDVRVYRGFTDFQEPEGQESDLIGFTLSWELDYINILSILTKNNVPHSSQARSQGHPIIFGGGPVLSANPEPFAEIFDVVLLGDAEVTVANFLAKWKSISSDGTGKTRQDKLIALAGVPGLYVPSLYNIQYESGGGPIASLAPGHAAAPPRLSKQLFTPPSDYVAHTVIVSPDTSWGDIFLVEVARSCPQECRFCLASYLTRPFRATNVDALFKAIDLGLAHTKNIGLLGPSVTEHPQFDLIADRLRERSGARVSVASVRADTLTENVLTALKALGQHSITIAIESGSERLREVMKKNLQEKEIEQAVELVDSCGLAAIKFYGMVGLPHETWEDIDQTVQLIKRLKKKHKRLRFVFGISSFVPKAQTPFQWMGRDRKSGDKIEYVRKHLAPLGVDVRPESHNWSDIQALISRGDRRLAPILYDVARSGGKLGAWKRALRQLPSGGPGLEYYAFRTIPESELLPWSHLVEVKKTEYLLKHNLEAEAVAVKG
jgi:radical SAM superfamily enzyme YgiQ (UPF0313 family)